MSMPERYTRNTIRATASEITLIVCNWCGSYIADPGQHDTACPKIKPPSPDPIDVMASIVEAMRKASQNAF